VTSQANTLLCLEARDRIKRRRRLTQAHYEAVRDASIIPDESRAKILNAHRALTLSDARARKRLTEWDMAFIVRECPEVADEVLAYYRGARPWRRRSARFRSLGTRRVARLRWPTTGSFWKRTSGTGSI